MRKIKAKAEMKREAKTLREKADKLEAELEDIFGEQGADS